MEWCFECRKPAQQNHHVVPVVLGGTKTVPLCDDCHGKIHSLNFTRHGELIKLGQAKARAKGVKIGRRSHQITVEQLATVSHLSSRNAAKILDVSDSTVCRRRIQTETAAFGA